VRHPIRWLVGGLLVVVLAVVGFGAWYIFGDSAPGKPKLSSNAKVDAGARATPAGAWAIAPGTDVYVGYRIKELFAGDTIEKDAVGRTSDVTGSMNIARDQVTATTINADLQKLKSNRAARDNYIHTHAIESDRFPRATFVLTSPIRLPATLRAGATQHVDAEGRLTLHGMSKPITIPLDARWNGSTIDVVGTAPIILADYDVQAPKTGVVAVQDHGSLELKLTFRRRA
jgi:polyisoprenoid-binding protein YceI